MSGRDERDEGHYIASHGTYWATERLRTEVDVRCIRSTNPGYCYLMAGWERGELKRGKQFLYAPVAEVEAPQLVMEFEA